MHISIVSCNKLEHIYYIFTTQHDFLLQLTRKYSKVVFGDEKKWSFMSNGLNPVFAHQ